MYGPERRSEILLARVGSVRLALPLDSVVGVDLEGSVSEVDGFAAFGGGAGSERRRVRVRGAAGHFDLVVGTGVIVRRVDTEAVLPLPFFLQGMASTGLAGVVRVDDGLALYVDPVALGPR